MIKINLLPTQKARKTYTIKVGIKPNISLFIGALITIFLLEGFTWYWINSKIAFLTKEKQTLDQKLKEIKEKVKEVENYEKDKKVYKERIAIIQNLKKNQKGPVHMLDELSRMLPEKVWLVSVKDTGKDISITGSGVTNDDIVKYINNLKASKLFRNVQLLESRQIIDSGIPIYSFNLTFSLNLDTV